MVTFPFNKIEVLMMGLSQREQEKAWQAFVQQAEEAGMEIVKNRDPINPLCDYELQFGTEEDFENLRQQARKAMETVQ